MLVPVVQNNYCDLKDTDGFKQRLVYNLGGCNQSGRRTHELANQRGIIRNHDFHREAESQPHNHDDDETSTSGC